MPEPKTNPDILGRIASDLNEVWGDDFTLDDLSERLIAETTEELAFRADVEVADIDRTTLQSILAFLITQRGQDCLVWETPELL